MRLSALVETSGVGVVPVALASSDPEVLAVVTTDLLDPSRYLVGGELVLTGLAWWRVGQPQRSRAFVAALVRAGVAALAAGEAELGEVPADLVKACADAGLGLLRVPVAVSFSAVIERAGQILSPRRSQDLAAVLGRHRALLSAATGGQSGAALARDGRGGPDRAAGLAAVLDWVSADLGLHCWVLSATGRLVGGTEPVPDLARRRRLARHFLRAEHLPHQVTGPGEQVISLFAAGDGPARVASWIVAVAEDQRRWTSARRGVVDELVGLVALERELTTRRSDVERQLAAALTADSAANVVAAMRRCGLAADIASVITVGAGRYAGAVLAEMWAEWPGAGALGEAGGEWIGVRVAEPSGTSELVDGADPARLVGQLRDVVGFLSPGLGPDPLHLGVSDPVSGGDGLLGAVAEARAAAAAGAGATGTAGTASHRHRVGGPELLSSHALLLAAVPSELRRAYRGRVLGPLLAHDRAHRSELVRTLEAYLDCSGSWSRCAARMHVHVNTLRYRIERIEALTGRDLRRLEDQADLLLALHLPG